MNDTIVTVRFTDLGAARRALRILKLLDSEGQLRVRAAALVERPAPGRVGGVFARPTEGFRAHGAPWSRAGERALALEEISRDLEPGVALVIAEVEDPDPDALDSALDALGGTPARRDAATFYTALRAA